MSRSAPEELALRWVPGEGPVTIQPSASGLVNQSYRVARGGREYSMRVAADAPGFGVEREWECRVLECAAAAGVAPAIECCEPRSGILVAEWVGGREWTPEEIPQPGKVHAMTGLLRRVHSLPIPQPARIVSPAAWIALYAAASTSRGKAAEAAAAPASAAAELREAADARIAELAAMSSAPTVLCHSDLHRHNVADGARLVLLDWEYAHVSDPYWDLGSWIANNDGTEDFAARLLAGYLERPPRPDEAARLRLHAWLYDYVCLQWSELYLSRRPGARSAAVAARAARLAARLRMPVR